VRTYPEHSLWIKEAFKILLTAKLLYSANQENKREKWRILFRLSSYSVSALFVILDPLLSVPVFTSMTNGQNSGEISRQPLITVDRSRFPQIFLPLLQFLSIPTRRALRSRASSSPEAYFFSWSVCRRVRHRDLAKILGMLVAAIAVLS
jgi:hypothetical protein